MVLRYCIVRRSIDKQVDQTVMWLLNFSSEAWVVVKYSLPMGWWWTHSLSHEAVKTSGKGDEFQMSRADIQAVMLLFLVMTGIVQSSCSLFESLERMASRVDDGFAKVQALIHENCRRQTNYSINFPQETGGCWIWMFLAKPDGSFSRVRLVSTTMNM